MMKFATRRLLHLAGYAGGVIVLVVVAIADDISTRMRNKSGANRRMD